MAFNQKDGAVAWRKHDFKNSTSSPILINVDGQEQLVAFMFSEIVGVEPNSGALLWSHPHPTDFGLNTSTPVWGEDNLLFVSSAYGGGSRVIKLTRNGDKTTVEQVWAHSLMRVHFGNCIRVGDLVFGSSGDFGPAPFTAVNVKTGKVAWRDRSLGRASFLYADGRFIVFTFRLAARMGAEGKVYAVDIDPEAINKVRQRKEREKLEQVEPIVGEGADPRLPNDLDAVLIVGTYHEFREYDRMMQAVFRALKPGGRLVIIDGEGPSGRPRTEYHRLHTIPAELVREEVARHGFVFKESRPGFYDPEYGKKMYFLIFERPLPNQDYEVLR